MRLTNKQIAEILKRYELGEFESKKLMYDEWNTAYRVKTSRGDYVLKIILNQSENELLREMYITEKLIDRLPCDLPIQVKGKYFIRYRNKIVLIKDYVSGRPELKGENLSDENLRTFGKYFAIIHKTRLKRVKKKDLFIEVDGYFKTVNKKSKEYLIAKFALDKLRSVGFDSARFPEGLVHGDLHTENILVNGGKIVAVLDFEDAHIGKFIYDLGLAVLDTCWKGGGLSKSRINYLLRGYNSFRKLTSVERRHLINSALFAGLYNLHFHVRKNGVNSKKTLGNYVVRRFLKLLEFEGLG
jgi:Ser/Thr protein kinase RdoA (MazF antagonist)